MFTIHYFENRTIVLTQLRKEIPAVDQDIKIKGKKGKVLSVQQSKDNTYQVYVQLEKVVKAAPLAADNKKKRR